MTIKLGNLADWRLLENKSLRFEAPEYDKHRPRRVRLDLNSECGCNWYIRFDRVPILNMAEYQIGKEPEYGKPVTFERFLAHVPQGQQTLEFTFGGDFELMPVRPDECEIQYWTSEAEEFWTEGDGETFSTIHERQPRNEALEYIMFQSAQNQLRRDKAHAAELQAMRAEIGAIRNERQSGIHGGEAEEHKKPKPAAKAYGKADGGKAAGAKAPKGPPAPDADGTDGAPESDAS